LLPVVLVVPHLLAVRADGLAHAARQEVLELDHSYADLEAGPQLVVIERLGDVIVRTGPQTRHDVLPPIFPGQEDDVDGLRSRLPPKFTADLRTVDAGHHPVEDRQTGRILPLERL